MNSEFMDNLNFTSFCGHESQLSLLLYYTFFTHMIQFYSSSISFLANSYGQSPQTLILHKQYTVIGKLFHRDGISTCSSIIQNMTCWYYANTRLYDCQIVVDTWPFLDTGSMVPFGMRLLHAEIPHYMGRTQEALDRLYYILAVTQKVWNLLLICMILNLNSTCY